MALPSIGRVVRLQPPTKGDRGIFAIVQQPGAGSRGIETGGHTVASPRSVSSPGSPRTVNASSLPAIGLSPRQLEAPEKDDQRSSTAPVQPTTSPRPQVNKERIAQHAASTVEARRAMRSLWPGDWDAAEFKRLRQRASEEGNLGAVRALHELAAKASEAALSNWGYKLPVKGKPEVSLPRSLQDEWFALQSVDAQQPETTFSPPAVCAALGPLEVLAALRSKQTKRPVVMSLDLTDFSSDGKIQGFEAVSAAQRDFVLRSDLVHHLRQVEVEVSSGRHTAQEHLRASSDPYIVIAHNVRIFRGPAEEGYPFLPLEACSNVTLLLSGRHCIRPEISKKGEYFISEDEVIAVMDRLHLFALAGLSSTESSIGPPWHTGPSPKGKPILILSMHDLTATAMQQPRHSIAAALKSWRKVYAHMFEAIIIACGNAQTAEMIDHYVNADLYNAVLNSAWKDGGWHWDLAYLDLCSTPMLPRLGRSVQAARGFGQAKGEASGAQSARGPPSRRRSSMNVTMLETRREVLQDLEQDMQDTGVIAPKSVWQQARLERKKSMVAADTRRVSFHEQGAQTVGNLDVMSEASSPLGNSRRSLKMQDNATENNSSRVAFERAFQHRLVDVAIQEERRKSVGASLSAATARKSLVGVVAGEMSSARSLGSIGMGGNSPRSAQEEPEQKASKLEEQRRMNKAADMLGMSPEVKAALARKRQEDLDEEELEYRKLCEEEEVAIEDDIQRLATSFLATQERKLSCLSLPNKHRSNRRNLQIEALTGADDDTFASTESSEAVKPDRLAMPKSSKLPPGCMKKGGAGGGTAAAKGPGVR